MDTTAQPTFPSAPTNNPPVGTFPGVTPPPATIPTPAPIPPTMTVPNTTYPVQPAPNLFQTPTNFVPAQPTITPPTSVPFFANNNSQIQSTYQFERLMNVNRSLFDTLIDLQKKNNELLGKLTESSLYMAKIAKKRHRFEVIKFWVTVIKYLGLLTVMGAGFILSYQMLSGFMRTVAPTLNQLNQSANTIQEINGSLGGLQNLGLGGLFNQSNEVGNSTETASANQPKDYPSSLTEPESTFTTPAFISDMQNIDLSNVDGESILKKLNIRPYKSKEIEVPTK